MSYTTIVGDRKRLPIAKNHPKTSQEFSEEFGPVTHKMKAFTKNSHQKVHPNFAKTLETNSLEYLFWPQDWLSHEERIAMSHSIFSDLCVERLFLESLAELTRSRTFEQSKIA